MRFHVMGCDYYQSASLNFSNDQPTWAILDGSSEYDHLLYSYDAEMAREENLASSTPIILQ